MRSRAANQIGPQPFQPRGRRAGAYRLTRAAILSLLVLAPLGGARGQNPTFPGYSSPEGEGRTAAGPAFLSTADSTSLNAVLEASRTQDANRMRASLSSISDPLARRLALWALIDSAPTAVNAFECEQARRELAGWPRSARRQGACEASLNSAAMSPADVVAWFAGNPPQTARGLVILATALSQLNRGAEAAAVLREGWRTLPFDASGEQLVSSALGSTIGPEDRAARETMLRQGAAERAWRHGGNVVDALQRGDFAGAYSLAANSGLTTGVPAAEATFLAGWIALTKLHDPRLADQHFARLQTITQTPLTQSRALFWRGRTAQLAGDPVDAQLFFSQASVYVTTFYGQLAAAETGATTLNIGQDPRIGAADRARFDAFEPIRAMKILISIGARDTFRIFATDLSENLGDTISEALLVDLTRSFGEQDLSMRVVRNAAKRGFILPERGYPVRRPSLGYDAPELPFVLAITRQESNFNPEARSGVGARGLMQLMPATAEHLASRLGLSYGAGDLFDPDYNMRLGAAFLGQLIGQFSGSYVMAAAAYNAGPGRPSQWTAECGDPRGSSADPLDFIECIPFHETRDYVMRVMESTQVYRARLNGGSAPLRLPLDLRRGAYGYATSGSPTALAGPRPPTPPAWTASAAPF